VALRDDARLRARMGAAARRTVEKLYSGAAWARKQAFFTEAQPETLRGHAPPTSWPAAA
jgi:hypothetical protein